MVSSNGSRPADAASSRWAECSSRRVCVLFTCVCTELGIVLVGTEETDNELAAEADDDSSYQHVSVLRPLQKPDLALLESIRSAVRRHEQASSCESNEARDI